MPPCGACDPSQLIFALRAGCRPGCQEGRNAAAAPAQQRRVQRARARAGFGPPDHNYTTWTKQEEPFLPFPPEDLGLVGWRDPFIFERKGLEGNGCEWGMLLGSGLKDGGGAVMIYRSANLRGGAAPRAPPVRRSGAGRGPGQHCAAGSFALCRPARRRCRLPAMASGLQALWGEVGVLLRAGAPWWGRCFLFGMWFGGCESFTI